MEVFMLLTANDIKSTVDYCRQRKTDSRQFHFSVLDIVERSLFQEKSLANWNCDPLDVL